MLFLAKFIANVFSVLNSEESPRQIAAGFAFGVLLGFLPLGVLATVLGLLAFLVNINLTMMGVAAFLFKLISYAVDPVANKIGYHLLVKTPALQGFWTTLYNMPVVPYTTFNNTIVLGSFVVGVLLLAPMYFVALKGLALYRTHARDRILKWKILQAVKASSFYKYYLSYRGFRGG